MSAGQTAGGGGCAVTTYHSFYCSMVGYTIHRADYDIATCPPVRPFCLSVPLQYVNILFRLIAPSI